MHGRGRPHAYGDQPRDHPPPHLLTAETAALLREALQPLDGDHPRRGDLAGRYAKLVGLDCQLNKLTWGVVELSAPRPVVSGLVNLLLAAGSARSMRRIEDDNPL
jgi:hypothetical protein